MTRVSAGQWPRPWCSSRRVMEFLVDCGMAGMSLIVLAGRFADDAYQGDEPPDLSPLRELAELEELAEATGHLADACGRPQPRPASHCISPARIRGHES